MHFGIGEWKIEQNQKFKTYLNGAKQFFWERELKANIDCHQFLLETS